MTSRERVLAVLAGQMPDRVPWMENFVSREVIAGLQGIRGIVPAPHSDRVLVPPEARRLIPLDNLTYDFSPARFTVTVRSGGQDIITDGRIKTAADLAWLEGLPDPDDEAFYRPAEAFLREHKGDAAAVAIVRTGISNTYLSMGIEHFSTALVRDPGLVREVLHRFCEWSVRVARHVHELPFDLFLVPDDLGFTNGPMMSMTHFREFCLPVMRRLIGSLCRPAIYHSDGDIHALLEEILALGVAGVANLEPGPMDIARVKREFGHRVTLMGNVDLHYLLTRGTPEETSAEVRWLIESIGASGRYILASANSLPDYVRPENVRAMGEALLEFGNYPIAVTGAVRPAALASPSPAPRRPAHAAPGEAGDAAFHAVQMALETGDETAIRAEVRALLAQGQSARHILERGLMVAMDRVGARFRDGEVFIPEVLLSAQAMDAAIALLAPHLAESAAGMRGRILLGTVAGDMHSIGKNVVATMLRGAGFDVIDLGINISKEDFAAKVADLKPDVLALSSLLTSTMSEMQHVIEALQARNLRDKVKVIVGGAPVTEQFAQAIGADGYSSNAGEAVTLVRSLLGLEQA